MIDTIKNAFFHITRTFITLMIMLIGWGYLCPMLVSAANTGWVFVGLFLVPLTPFMAWVAWKVLFRNN